MSWKYVLRGHEPVPCDDVVDWAMWMESSESQRVVGKDQIGPYLVSTIFLGVNLNYWLDGTPMLFETIVHHAQDGRGEPDRSATWIEAETKHAIAVAQCREKVN